MKEPVVKEFTLQIPMNSYMSFTSVPDFEDRYCALNGILELFNKLELDVEQKRNVLICVNQFYGFK